MKLNVKKIGAVAVATAMIAVSAFAVTGCSFFGGDNSESDEAEEAEDGVWSTSSASALVDPGTVDWDGKKNITAYLDAYETTGYSWNVSIEGEGVELVSNEYTAAKTGAAGQGGTSTIVFNGVSAGTPTITLTYAHEWEIDASKTDEITITCTVDESGNISDFAVAEDTFDDPAIDEGSDEDADDDAAEADSGKSKKQKKSEK